MAISEAMAGRGIRFEDIGANGYTKIANHGMIASNRTAALVGMDGKIDWACFPSFKDNPVFDSILDKKKGGYFSIRPAETEGLKVIQNYYRNTNILVTEFLRKQTKILELTDFIPASGYSMVNFPEIHRRINAPAHDVEVSIDLKPSFDFRSGNLTVIKSDDGYIFSRGSNEAALSTVFDLETSDRGSAGNVLIRGGTSSWLVFVHGVSSVNRVSDYRSDERLSATAEYWNELVKARNFKGMFSKVAVRSALTLKALFYEPTGLMVAAPTSSLPECLGGERNWDYRYAWIRDTAYVAEALSMINYREEAIKFLYDIMQVVQREKRLRTIYPIDLDGSLEEFEVDYEGFMGSRPVRIGNKAAKQLQIDEYGSLVNAVYYVGMNGGLITTFLWHFVMEILDDLSSIWDKPDSTIWEFRTEPKHYVYSKAMAWTAFTRAITLGKFLGYSAPYEKWQEMADMIRTQILTKGYDKETNSFVQFYGSRDTDGSLLRLPHLGILPPDDPRIRGTVERIEKDLMTDNYLFRRYLNDDGFRCQDNAFTLLSCWYVEDLILFGDREKAREVFRSLISHGNHLSLFSEEIDLKSGDQVGNFPQAMTHLGIIRAWKSLNKAFGKP
jgi:GH15 family glucan-1,4-alpha-glucosidase